MRIVLTGIRFTLTALRSQPGDLQGLATTPLFTVVFLSIVLAAGREDLLAHALLAPVLMAVLGEAILSGGEIIDQERWQGTLEAVVAAPGDLGGFVLGRALAVTGVGLVSLLEVWLVARLLFGIHITPAHPFWFVSALLVLAAGTAGITTVFAALFVLARSARTFQNSISYPLYVLGGVIVPLDLLPGWMAGPGRLLFLSWVADVLRDSLDDAPLVSGGARLAVATGLAALSFAGGRLLLHAVVRRVRRTGSITYA